MAKLLLLLIIIGIKVLLTRVFSLLMILFSFFIKGKSIHFDTEQWNIYFRDIKQNLVLNYAKSIYIIATVFSSFIVYLLFRLAKFQYPVHLTIILCLLSIFFTSFSYIRKIKKKLIITCNKLHEKF